MRSCFQEAVDLLDKEPDFDAIPIADGAGDSKWVPTSDQSAILEQKGYSLSCLNTFKEDNIWHIVRN